MVIERTVRITALRQDADPVMGDSLYRSELVAEIEEVESSLRNWAHQENRIGEHDGYVVSIEVS